MNTFNLSALTSSEVYTSVQRVDTIVAGNVSTDPFIIKVRPLITNSSANLTIALGRTNDSTLIKLLENKDILRDNRYVALRDYCKAMVTDEDAEKTEAASLLVKIIKELGWGMHHEGYATESSKLQALIGRFTSEPGKTAIATIGAETKLSLLKDAATDFELTYSKKVDDKTKEEYPKIHDCRKTIIRYISAELSYIDIMAELEGGNFAKANAQIEEVVKEFEAIARSRETKKKKNEASTDTKVSQ
jgi:hypothetical protein